MDIFLLAAGIIALLTGAVHSILGEYLIFRHLRRGGLIPSQGAAPLKLRHTRIIWASWHIVTVFGWAISFLLLRMANSPIPNPVEIVLLNTIIVANSAGAALVLIGTRGRHPGWIALLSIALLALASDFNAGYT